jgi:glycine cleavage system H protein
MIYSIYITRTDFSIMSNVPENLKYTKTHEWVSMNGNIATVGITDYAQHQLTDIVFVDFPKIGEVKKKGAVLLTVESVKSAEDVFSPVDGEVSETNKILVDSPELLNKDSYKNWMVRMKVSSPANDLLSPADYRKHIGE